MSSCLADYELASLIKWEIGILQACRNGKHQFVPNKVRSSGARKGGLALKEKVGIEYYATIPANQRQGAMTRRANRFRQ